MLGGTSALEGDVLSNRSTRYNLGTNATALNNLVPPFMFGPGSINPLTGQPYVFTQGSNAPGFLTSIEDAFSGIGSGITSTGNKVLLGLALLAAIVIIPRLLPKQ